MNLLPLPLTKLVSELSHLPGIGPKTAQRLAFHLLDRSPEEVARLASAMVEAREKVSYCEVCGHLTETSPCPLCSDPTRDRKTLCVVEEPKDVIALEKTREFHGLYHVLHGAMSPLDGIGPEELHIRELLNRINEGEFQEVILACNPNIEGEATALYLARLLKPLGLQVTRLARGLPIGGDLEYIDEVTLGKALEGRSAI
jgi:recombination protein RecR